MGKSTKKDDFTTRRTQKLIDENHDLKEYVAAVMKRLHDNETLFSKLFELESQVLAATDSEDLCFTLLRGLRTGFDLDMVRLWFDRSSFMGQCQLTGLSEHDLVWIEKGEIEKIGLTGRNVWLLRLDKERDFPWLEDRDAHLASLAVLVLGPLSRPFGVLAMGSVDGTRFAPEQSSDFLQHLAQIIGLTLENSIVRERLARSSVTDGVTGAHNRRFFQPHSHQPLSQWFGGNVPVACMCFEVDDFKVISEQLGQAEADEALMLVSEKIRHCVRAQDTFIRMGGDAFAVFLPGCSVDKAGEIAQRMVSECAALVVKDEKMGISLGVAFSSGDDDKVVKVLLSEADQAMYVAKALGGSRVELSASAS